MIGLGLGVPAVAARRRGGSVPPASPPEILATTSGVEPSSLLAVAIAMPAGVEAGDVLVTVFSNDGSAAATTASEGWQLLRTGVDPLNRNRGTIFWKIATGSDALTVNMAANEASAWIVYRIGNADTVDASVPASGDSTTPNPPELVLSQSRDAVWIAAFSQDSLVTVNSVPGEYSGLQVQSSNASVAAVSRSINALSQDPANFVTAAINDWTAFTIAVYKI